MFFSKDIPVMPADSIDYDDDVYVAAEIIDPDITDEDAYADDIYTDEGDDYA